MRTMPRGQLARFAAGLIFAMSFDTTAHADLIETVMRMKPSVVLVGTYGATDSPRFAFRGTGFIVDTGNLAITNAHVLPEALPGNNARSIVVQVWSEPGQWNLRSARVAAMDRIHDLALLEFDGPRGNPVTLAQVAAREGAAVAFMGFPIGGALGFSHVTHRATISAITSVALPAPTANSLNSRNITQIRTGAFNIMQLDGTAYPGNSGGPLFDLQSGDVVGVVNMVLLKGTKESALTQPSGISYAIPVAAVIQFLESRGSGR